MYDVRGQSWRSHTGELGPDASRQTQTHTHAPPAVPFLPGGLALVGTETLGHAAHALLGPCLVALDSSPSLGGGEEAFSSAA